METAAQAANGDGDGAPESEVSSTELALDGMAGERQCCQFGAATLIAYHGLLTAPFARRPGRDRP